MNGCATDQLEVIFCATDGCRSEVFNSGNRAIPHTYGECATFICEFEGAVLTHTDVRGLWECVRVA